MSNYINHPLLKKDAIESENDAIEKEPLYAEVPLLSVVIPPGGQTRAGSSFRIGAGCSGR